MQRKRLCEILMRLQDCVRIKRFEYAIIKVFSKIGFYRAQTFAFFVD